MRLASKWSPAQIPEGHFYRYDASGTLSNGQGCNAYACGLYGSSCSRSMYLCMRAQGTDTSEASVIEQSVPANYVVHMRAKVVYLNREQKRGPRGARTRNPQLASAG